jgi:hypothetical protein
MMANDISEAKSAFLNNDDLLRNIADTPWAKKELSDIQKKSGTWIYRG